MEERPRGLRGKRKKIYFMKIKEREEQRRVILVNSATWRC